MSPTGELPVLRDGTRPVAGVLSIIEYLKRKGLDLDSHLSPTQLSQSHTYISLISDKLIDALLYNYWLEDENYTTTTRPTYASAMDMFRRYYIPSRMNERVKRRLKVYRFMLDADAKLTNEVYLMARTVYAALAAKLGSSNFFFNNTPSTLDAIAYAHLSLHSSPILQSPRLFATLAFEFPTLIAYVDRMRQLTWPKPLTSSILSIHDAGQEEDSTRYQDTSRDEEKEGSEEEVAVGMDALRQQRVSTFYKVVSVVGAVMCFLAFVVSKGIVKVELNEMDHEVDGSRGGDDDEEVDVGGGDDEEKEVVVERNSALLF